MPVVATPAIVSIGPAASARNSSPIFIVDRVPAGVVGINSGDIETVEIIKGPAAAALYAPLRRGCPPIVITTRRAPNASRPRPAVHEKTR
jgi:hypothetical protein